VHNINEAQYFYNSSHFTCLIIAVKSNLLLVYELHLHFSYSSVNRIVFYSVKCKVNHRSLEKELCGKLQT